MAANTVKGLRAENRRLEIRINDLLTAFVRLTQETPFPDEMKDWQATRAAMTAEVGTLRARVAELERDRDGLRERVPRFPFDVRCADALADEVDFLVRSKLVDSRSPVADALIDYRNPPTSPRSDRMFEGESRTAVYTMSAIAKFIEDKAVAASADDTVNVTSVAGEFYRELAAEIRRWAWRR